MARRAIRRSVAGLLGIAAATVLGGCTYLFGFDPTSPEFPPSKPAATYHSGSASLAIGSDPPIVLGNLSTGGSYEAYGSEATFRNDDGWHLRIMGATAAAGMFGQTAYISIDRIVGTEHWTTYDSTRCVVTVSRADETGLAGTATCKGLRWSDAIGGGLGTLEPPYIKDQPAFDAEITFEAKPSETLEG